MFKNDVINIYTLYYAELKKKCTGLQIPTTNCFSLADLNIGHCVEMTFLEGKVGRFLMLAFLK